MRQLRQPTLSKYKSCIQNELYRAAREHRLITYSELMQACPIGRGYVGQVLDAINDSENKAGRPILSAIVVRKDSNFPGPGFWTLEPIPHSIREGSFAIKRQYWIEVRDSVWSYAWPK